MNDQFNMVRDYNNLGNIYRYQGNFDNSMHYHNNALSLDEKLDNKAGMAIDYIKIGEVL